ncbi:MAG: hypothetical protein JJU06_10520 [Ectothiorhodospiraceae bacterium]|nr:hypothetical protein [Ectothiorhodospiraceae bacterium]
MRGMRTNYQRQRGAALIISLMLLLIMTLIGVTAMQTSTLQERMAGNSRDRSLAFQSSEAALREGEDWVMANFAGLDTADRLDNPAAWDGSDFTGSLNVDAAQLAGPAVFHAGPPRRARVGVTVPPEWRYFYPVTSRGEGGRTTTVIILRTTVEP